MGDDYQNMSGGELAQHAGLGGDNGAYVEINRRTDAYNAQFGELPGAHGSTSGGQVSFGDKLRLLLFGLVFLAAGLFGAKTVVSDAWRGDYGKLKFVGICFAVMAVIALLIGAGRLLFRVAGKHPVVTTAIVIGSGWYWFHISSAAPSANQAQPVLLQQTAKPQPHPVTHRKKKVRPDAQPEIAPPAQTP